jgi:prophage tail gpP-like protein
VADPRVKLLVNGAEYAGWTSARVTRSLESLAGSFSLGVSDRWRGQRPWPISEEDECSVKVGDETLLTGYVDDVELTLSESDRSITVAGRDRTADLVDCSAVLSTWEFLGQPLERIARQLAEPFGVGVSVQPGLVIPALTNKVAVDPGDSAWEALEKGCRMAGVLAVSDGQGGLVLTRASTTSLSTALVEGLNILAGSSKFSAAGKFRTYRVMGQQPGTDEDFGLESSSVAGEATDASVRREARVLLVRAETSVTRTQARTRAQWEASVRAARGDAVQVTVHGWTQGSGQLWPVNALVRVKSPSLRVDGHLLITEAAFSLDSSTGTTTQLSLRRPDAFAPQPVVSATGAGTAWKELAKGVRS